MKGTKIGNDLADSFPAIYEDGILFVDDDPSIRDTFSSLIHRKVECELFKASNAKEAREWIKDCKFKVIICDHYMPDRNGDVVYSFSRTDRSMNKETPFIHHSSDPQPRLYRNIHPDDPNFYSVAKNGDTRELFSILKELGFKLKEN